MGVEFPSCQYPYCERYYGGCHEGCRMSRAVQTKINPGWRGVKLESAVEAVCQIPELNLVLDRESSLLAQNIMSAVLAVLHEDQAATVINDECKKVLARSLLVGLQYGMTQT